jgi:acyl-CoA reductase-like NAD-dependent aldehyde dehydrogenase
MYNTGQSCCSVERIYVHEKMHDAFVKHFVDTVQGFKVGDPMSAGTYIGAITRAPQLDVLDAQVADAKAKGATLLCRRRAPARPRQLVPPTVFSNVNHTWS